MDECCDGFTVKRRERYTHTRPWPYQMDTGDVSVCVHINDNKNVLARPFVFPNLNNGWGNSQNRAGSNGHVKFSDLYWGVARLYEKLTSTPSSKAAVSTGHP